MKSTYLVILLALLFIWQQEPIFAQDSFNTQKLFESSRSDGEFIDVIAEDQLIYTIAGNYLKVYELTDIDSINQVSSLNIAGIDSYPSKLLKRGNKIVILYTSSLFPNNDHGGIKIYEIDTDHAINFLSKFDINGFKFDFTLTDKYIFVAAGESGLYILDYQNPTVPFITGRYNPGGYSTGNGIIHVSVDGNIASISMASEGLDIIDILNISQPTKLLSMFGNNEGVNAAILYDGYLYAFLKNSSSCEIYDISDVFNPELKSKVNTVEIVRDVSIVGNYLFISEYGTYIIDITDRAYPFYIGYTTRSKLDLSHFVDGVKIYTTSFENNAESYIYKLAIYSFNNLNSIITLNEPSPYFSWVSNELQSIDISAYNVNSINLEISSDAGATWGKVLENYKVSGYNKKIYFTVPQIFSYQCLLRVSDSQNNDIFDISSKPFTIKQNIIFDRPKGGTFINEVNIVWASESLNRFSLFYNVDNSLNWKIIDEDFIDSTEYWKHYNWQFQNINAENVKIKIVSYYDSNTFAVSPDITLKTAIAIDDTTFEDYSTFFPLQVGNFWQYKVTNIVGYQDYVDKGYDSMKVLSDTTIENEKYFKLETSEFGNTVKYLQYLRYDSLQNSILSYYYSEEVSFKLDSKTGECWSYEGGAEICNRGTYLESIFGLEKPVIHCSQSGFNSRSFGLAEDFGQIWMYNDQSYINTDIWYYDLVYAKIGGVEFGIFVSVEDKNRNIPNNFSLSQNYPNPFNPTTNIKYTILQNTHPSIPSGEGKERSDRGVLVTLKVYDILGREVATIVNKAQSAGSYDVEFNASNLTSGVYFYRLKTGSFVETKKMLLLR